MITSPNDKKQYEQVTLSNGLRVLFVGSESTSKSACSLVINVGSFNDPHDRPGFAHFVEHLLFNGNEADPEPNLLNNFVSLHGGQCNAWTASEHTCFHFDVQNEYFEQTLEHFSNLFISPLFSEEAITKEQQAIHSEYKLKLKDDSRRIQQVHKETCNPEHPFSKFAVGNRHTLSDLPQRPVIEEINQFWESYYCSQLMTLTVVTPQITAELVSFVTERFSKIQQLKTRQENNQLPSLYRPQDLGSFIQIKPLKELHKLNITFALPGIDVWYGSQLPNYVAHIMSYEGKGSLFDLLRELGLANVLSAGNGIEGSNFKDFNVSIELTESGEQQLDQIFEHVFSYVNWLKDNVPPSYLYQEQKSLANVGFNFQEDVKPLQIANGLALNMQHYSDEDIIFGDYRMDGVSNKDWQQFWQHFSAQNMRVTLLSQNISTSKEAHWYHTPYDVTDIPNEVLDSLNEVPAGEFQFPQPNPYLQQEVELQAPKFSEPQPIKIAEHRGFRTWFKQDVSFRVPKGNIYIGMDLPNAVKDKKHQAQVRLFCELFLDAVSEQHYQAEMAGLNYNLYAHNSGITIYTSGLNNGQPQLMKDLVVNLLTIRFSESRFDEIKRQLLKHWRNNLTTKPINQLFTKLNSVLLPEVASSRELADELDELSFAQFVEFRGQLFDQAFVETLIYGNWSMDQASYGHSLLVNCFEQSTCVNELPRVLPKKLIMSQPIEHFVEHSDIAALYYLQCSNADQDADSDREKSLFILVSQIMSPFSFDYLRNEHRLGYLAGSGYMPIANQPGLAIYVQSHDTEGPILLSYIKQCIEAFCNELNSITVEEFEKYKHAVIQQYSEKPTNLNQKSQQLWTAIGHQDFSFSAKQQVVDDLTQISISDIQHFCQLWAKDPLQGIMLSSKNTL